MALVTECGERGLAAIFISSFMNGEFGQHRNYNLTPCNVKIKHITVSYPCNVPTEEIFAQQVRYSFSFPQTEFSVRWRDEGNLCKCVYFPFLCLFQSQNGGSKAERLLGSI